MKIMALFLVISCATICGGQDRNLSNPKKYTVRLVAGGGRSIFHTNVLKSQTRYPTPEYRFGFIVNSTLNNKVEFQARPFFGIKKRGEVQNVLTPFNFLEESTKRDYVFSEVSFLTNYSVYRNIKIKSGLNSRFFFPSSNIAYDFLGSRFDFGLIVGFSVKLSNRIYIGSEYMFGLTKVLKLNYFDSNLKPQSGLLEIQNRIAQITLEYSLNTRKIVK